MQNTTKEKLLDSFRKVVLLDDYDETDCIFSQKYNIPPVIMVYILKQLEADFNFTISDDFVDALEMCTFAQLEELMEQYGRLRDCKALT